MLKEWDIAIALFTGSAMTAGVVWYTHHQKQQAEAEPFVMIVCNGTPGDMEHCYPQGQPVSRQQCKLDVSLAYWAAQAALHLNAPQGQPYKLTVSCWARTDMHREHRTTANGGGIT